MPLFCKIINNLELFQCSIFPGKKKNTPIVYEKQRIYMWLYLWNHFYSNSYKAVVVSRDVDMGDFESCGGVGLYGGDKINA